MAETTLTTNLKLRISSDLTSDSKYNLQRIDTLGAQLNTDSGSSAIIRSQSNIFVFPNDTDVGGTGVGGTVQVGTVDQPADLFNVYASVVRFSGGLSFKDQGALGTQDLVLKYKSDISGATDTVAGRSLSFDVEGANREISFPLNGAVAVIAGAQVLTNKTISALTNTLGDIANANIAVGAGILGSKILPNFGAQEINSTVGFSSTSGVAFRMPNSDGTAGQVLTTTGSGELFFTSAVPTVLNSLTDVSVFGATAGQILSFTGSTWVNSAVPGGNEIAQAWNNADGVSITIVHNFGTRNILVQVLDNDDDYRTIEVDQVYRPTDNQIILASTIAPPTSWTVLLTQIA